MMPPRYNIYRLKEDDYRNEFALECRNKFTALMILDDMDVDECNPNIHWTNIKETYQNAGNSILGRGHAIKRKKWISDESWKLIEERATAKVRRDNTKSNDPEYQIRRAEYSSLNSEVGRCTRRDKRNYYNNVAEQTERQLNIGSAGNTKLAYEGIKELTGKRRKVQGMPVKSCNGMILTKDSDINKRWREHFQTVLNRPAPDEQDNIPEAETDLDIDTSDIRVEEVTKAIKRLKNNKTPGMDGIAAEMIKAEEIVTPIMFTRLFKSIWTHSWNPHDWKKDMMIRIPKKGDLRECGNWRGISLTSVALKLFSMVLLDRIEPHIDRVLRDEQAGFRKGRSCADQIFLLRHILQASAEMRQPLALCFVDFEKAFDSICRQTMKKIMRYYGIPVRIVEIIMDMHYNNLCQVAVDGTLTDPFEIKSGVLQGGILSPLLFTLVIDYVMQKTIGDGHNGIAWTNNRNLCDMEYADDAVLISSSVERLQNFIDTLAMEGKKVGLVINIRKTEVMKNEHAGDGRCHIGDHDLPNVNSFRYLGTIVESKGSLSLEFADRLKRANQAMGMMRAVWQSGNLSIHTKVRLYKTLVRSILMYGCESWYSTITSDSKILAFENKALRRILGIKWHQRIPNTAIRELTQLRPITVDLKLARWKWMGHVLRRDGRLVQDAVSWMPAGRRRPGRPRETWIRTMRREVGEECWPALYDLAQDRDIWREFIGALCIPWVPED